MKGSTLLGAGACLLIASVTPVVAVSETIQNFDSCSAQEFGCTALSAGNSNDLVECFTSLNLVEPFDLKEATYSIGVTTPPPVALNLKVYEWSGAGAPGALIRTIALGQDDMAAGPHTIILNPVVSLNSPNFCIGLNSEAESDIFRINMTEAGTSGTSWVKSNDCSAIDYVDMASIGYGNLCITATVDKTSIEVDIDIKFCSDPNAFNCKKNGALPVTIFGTDEFDVADIDLDSLRLCLDDMEACTTAGLKDWSIADRGDPATDIGANACAINETTLLEEDFLNQDGFDDLDVAFYARDVLDNLLVDFCSLDKGVESPTLILMGTTVGGITVHSLPIDDVAVDRLLKVSK